jgi:hypothetical protein
MLILTLMLLMLKLLMLMLLMESSIVLSPTCRTGPLAYHSAPLIASSPTRSDA